MENTEYLYHYTSIESLAAILKNRTIRLNPLDKMDDLQEKKTADIKNLGKFIFVSCWTDDSAESIPMWKMYTDSSAGVRIKLRKNPFFWHNTRGADIEKAIGFPPNDEASRSMCAKTFLDISQEIEKGYISPETWCGPELVEITYTDDISKLEPKALNISNDSISIKLETLGKYKNNYWSFQNEWRYVMKIFSMDFKENPDKWAGLMGKTFGRLIEGKEPPPFQYFDLEIDATFFSEMEITCSPQMSAGNRVLLEALIEKYNPTAKILDSDLLGKI